MRTNGIYQPAAVSNNRVHPATMGNWLEFARQNFAAMDVLQASQSLLKISEDLPFFNLLESNFKSLPIFKQMKMTLSAFQKQMREELGQGHTCSWDKMPGIKVIYPANMTGLSLHYVWDHRLNTEEVWLVQRFLQRLYAEFSPVLNPENMTTLNLDEFFSTQSIYNQPACQLPQTNILLPGHFFNSATNLNIAIALNTTLREDVYKRGFKSDNKQSSGELGKDRFYHTRRAVAEAANAQYRQKRAAFLEANYPFNHSEVFEIQAQNGGELLEMSAMILQHCGRQSRFVELNGLDHAVLLIGGNLPDHDAELEWKKIDDSCVVCDPWMNIVCEAPKYLTSHYQKMEKWQQNKKYLLERYNVEGGTAEALVLAKPTKLNPTKLNIKVYDFGPGLLRERKKALAQTSAPGA